MNSSAPFVSSTFEVWSKPADVRVMLLLSIYSCDKLEDESSWMTNLAMWCPASVLRGCLAFTTVRVYPTPNWLFRSRDVPTVARRPSTMIAMRSHSTSASSMLWVVSTMARCRLCFLITSHVNLHQQSKVSNHAKAMLCVAGVLAQFCLCFVTTSGMKIRSKVSLSRRAHAVRHAITNQRARTHSGQV